MYRTPLGCEPGGLGLEAFLAVMHDVRSVFTDHSLRCTRQRMDVYQALAATKSHPTAEQLHRTIQGSTPGISLATVYNTLEALINAGLVRKLAMRDGPARYDADVSNHLHVTTSDGQMVDMPEDLTREVMRALPADLKGRIESRLGASVEQISVDYFATPRISGSRE